MAEDVELSVVVPCYNDAACVAAFVEALASLNLACADHEIVFVDDGSYDDSLAQIRLCAAADPRVKYLSFSRNFGKEAALLAGLRAARGRYVVTMDIDLQDPPSLLPEMLRRVKSGACESVATRRVNRAGEPAIRSFFARQFYRAMRLFSDVELVDGARDYRLMSRPFVSAVLSLGEVNRFTKGIYQWVGFRTEWLTFSHVARSAGETSWSFWSLFRYAVDGLLAFSTVPLRIASVLGFLCCGVSFLAIAFLVLRYLMFGDPVQGWASTVCIIVFIGGIQLFVTGILGAYLARIYCETKHRPVYLVAESNVKDAPRA